MIGKIHKWNEETEGTPIICLHGFIGSGADYSIVVDHLQKDHFIVAPDFPDYKSVPLSGSHSWDSTLTQLDNFIQEIVGGNTCIMVGYSMGGRIALQYALRYKSALEGLVLIGASPGIKDPTLKLQRLEQDRTIASTLPDQTIDEFLDFWLSQPILKSQETIAEPYRSRMLERRRGQSLQSLASYLSTLGTGSMPSVWAQLHQLNTPTLLVTGEHDTKFAKVAEEMLSYLPRGEHGIIGGSGHSACFESPSEFAGLLETFIHKISTV